ncbi:hypothetical protein DAI22_11g199500 [Oryza sativa Japonica Group]|nr:hypothetical protein DAI22_11g199500 [Oryza sativa Japonica Group]
MSIWCMSQNQYETGPRARFSYSLHSFGYDSGITAAAMYIVMIDEIFRMLGYFLSRWAKLIAMCNFVNFRNRWLKYVIVNTPARYGERTIVIHQHAFLQTFSSSISGWKIFSCILERNQNARMVWSEGKMNDSMAKNVKAAVIQALRSMDLEGHLLSRDLPLSRVSDRAERYWLACLAEVPTCSRVILVWHIATSLCEIKLANDHKINLTTMSRLSSFLVDEKALTGELQKAYTVSNCLSWYCMYLLASKPKLLPETILMSKKAFQDAVQCAHEMLSDCHSWQSIYNKLMKEAQKALVQGTHGLNLSGNILQQGAILANELIKKEDQKCRWEILSDVWVHLLVHIAPSSDAAALAEDLKSGVEFVTVIWALFCHCGIEKSKLWQQQKSANFRNSTPGPSNQSSDVSTHVQDTVSSSPPAARSSEIHVEASPTSELNFSGNDHIRKLSIQSVCSIDGNHTVRPGECHLPS